MKNRQPKAASNRDLHFDNVAAYGQCRKLVTTVGSCTHCIIALAPGCENTQGAAKSTS